MALASSISIDVKAERSVQTRVTLNHALLAKELLVAAIQVGVRVDGIVLTDGCDLHAAHFAHGGIFQRVLEYLRSFTYFLHPETEANMLGKRAHHHWRILNTIAQDAQRLELLQLNANHSHVDAVYGSVLSELCAQALAIPHLACLQHLILEGINISVDTLAQLIQSCAATIEQIDIGPCGLVGDEDPCGKLFRALSEIPRLALINISSLSVRAEDDAMFEKDGFQQASFLLPGKGTDQRFEGIPDSELVSAKPFLELNIKHGIQYT